MSGERDRLFDKILDLIEERGGDRQVIGRRHRLRFFPDSCSKKGMEG